MYWIVWGQDPPKGGQIFGVAGPLKSSVTYKSLLSTHHCCGVHSKKAVNHDCCSRLHCSWLASVTLTSLPSPVKNLSPAMWLFVKILRLLVAFDFTASSIGCSPVNLHIMYVECTESTTQSNWAKVGTVYSKMGGRDEPRNLYHTGRYSVIAVKVSISKYRSRYRYFYGKVSISVSTILLKPASISNIGDTFGKYR